MCNYGLLLLHLTVAIYRETRNEVVTEALVLRELVNDGGFIIHLPLELNRGVIRHYNSPHPTVWRFHHMCETSIHKIPKTCSFLHALTASLALRYERGPLV
jgi:hypothetical protein